MHAKSTHQTPGHGSLGVLLNIPLRFGELARLPANFSARRSRHSITGVLIRHRSPTLPGLLGTRN